MRSKLGTGFCLAVFFIFLVFGNLYAQGQFTRLAEIPLPETDKNTGGIGNIIAGVDFDNDGKLEIYMVNDNWNDAADELIPRIYKLEKNGENWDLVWQAVAPVPMQNTWPALISGDIDKDNKMEIYWGVVNFTDAATNPNPKRILVYESAGDGSDVMGVSDGAGGYLPNASWTITDSNNVNIRPTRFAIADPDNDGTEELIFSDRAGNKGGYYCGIASVSNIPDNGDGSETWTLEASGLDYDLKAGTTENKWDVAVIGSNVYSFCEMEVTKFSWDGSSWIYEALSPMPGGSSFCGLSVVDLNNDGVKEIITAVYDWGTDAFKAINLLQEDSDTLKLTQLASVLGFWPSGSRGPMGTDYGDIDQDGNLDFVWGSRSSTPNAGIFRLAYRGGDITNPANYEFSIIDSLYATGGIWNVIDITNIDSDPYLEVLYGSSTDAGVFPNLGTQPIVILDYLPTAVEDVNKSVVTDFALNQNYPNPFNPTTTIEFRIQKSETVKLTIYNLQGQEVAKLIDPRLAAGSYKAYFDAKNLPSGLYFYTLEAGQNRIQKKMILSK